MCVCVWATYSRTLDFFLDLYSVINFGGVWENIDLAKELTHVVLCKTRTLTNVPTSIPLQILSGVFSLYCSEYNFAE